MKTNAWTLIALIVFLLFTSQCLPARSVEQENGRLIVTSIPARAQIFLDNKSIGYTPLQKLLPPGLYKLRVQLPNHKSWSKSVLLTKGSSQFATLLLKPIQAFARKSPKNQYEETEPQQFAYHYNRGKLFLKKELYFDARAEFKQAIRTSQGQKHFAAHFFLAKAYYWMPNLHKAQATTKVLKGLSKTEAQAKALKRLNRRIRSLYGKVYIRNHTTTLSNRRLKIQLKLNNKFSNQHKIRYLRLFQKKLVKNGGLLPSKQAFYLPQGEYILSIQKPQCFYYGLKKTGQLIKKLTVGYTDVELSVQQKQSCDCDGGQKLLQKGKSRYCDCPQGTAWNDERKRCEIPTVQFRVGYRRGKFYLKKKVYAEAIRELGQVRGTPEGRRHFGVNYLLAKAYYWKPDIQKAAYYLSKSKSLIKNNNQKMDWAKLFMAVKKEYGKLQIIPYVDPDEVGPLRLQIKSLQSFSNWRKKRYLQARLKTIAKRNGIELNSKPIYLPKGRYQLKLQRPQCFNFALVQGTKRQEKIQISNSPTRLLLKKQPSCRCQGGQKLYRDGNRQYCACPPGSAWNRVKSKCYVQ